MRSTHTIPLSSVELAYAAARMRRANGGRTCQMAAVTAFPNLIAHCGAPHLNRPGWLEECKKAGTSRVTTTVMRRGGLHDLIERVRLNHGLAEVRKTWGVGIRTLLAETRHILNGGRS